MKVFAILATVLVTVSAAPQNYNYDGPVGGASSLSQAQVQAQATEPVAPPQYQFTYEVNALDGLNSQVNYGQTEQRDGDYTSGQYFVLLPDTRLMRVSYYSDATGFHPTITFEGTAQYPQPQQYAQQFQAAASAPAAPPALAYNTPVGK